MTELRVLIVSASPLTRAGMQVLLEGERGLRVAGTTEPAGAAVLAAQVQPDVVLLDAGAGEMEDLEAIGRLTAAQPGMPVVALAESTAAAEQALALGTASLLPASADGPTVSAALLAAAHGLVSILRADLVDILPAEERVDPGPAEPPAESLTPRELEVLQWMARGLTNRQIAMKLRISEHTVKFHAGTVLGKLSARSRTEAVARAIALGWILV